MLHINFQGHRPFGSRVQVFLKFLPYMGMEAIWPCDLEHLNKLSFPHSMEAPYEIWLQLAWPINLFGLLWADNSLQLAILTDKLKTISILTLPSGCLKV